MADKDARLIALTSSVLAAIKDDFEEGDIGELMITCPFDGETFYDIYPSDDQKSFNLIVGDDFKANDPRMANIASQDLAKALIASLIAERLIAAQDLLHAAEEADIDLD